MALDGKLRYTSIVLLVIGLLVSLYLTWVKLSNTSVVCGPFGECDTVNSSQYSEIFGIPIAILGALAYLTILLLLFLENRGKFWFENGNFLVFGISLIGTLYSAYLTYIEVAVLRAICPYCVVSAVVITLVMFLSLVRLVKIQQEI
ncbi:MAG: vitamin K epoxide reductase family protein [Anaerolineales bacterium]